MFGLCKNVDSVLNNVKSNSNKKMLVFVTKDVQLGDSVNTIMTNNIYNIELIMELEKIDLIAYYIKSSIKPSFFSLFIYLPQYTR